ncbi:hypothetical protein X734_29415 [Mesorhizobium sp. L2C084A000]|nr:hypothetical protein X734_29415 [Mesorhizobium sp. L2C084A000]
MDLVGSATTSQSRATAMAASIWRLATTTIATAIVEAPAPKQPISPLVGEMSGRTEGAP